VVFAGASTFDPEVAPAGGKLTPVQDVTLVEDHVTVVDLPLEIEVGFAWIVAVGADKIARTSTPSTFEFASWLVGVGANEMVIFPLASAFAVNVFAIALCCAPVAAKMSKLERTCVPLMLTFSRRFPAAVSQSSVK
jgi:hypothetical protein